MTITMTESECKLEIWPITQYDYEYEYHSLSIAMGHTHRMTLTLRSPSLEMELKKFSNRCQAVLLHSAMSLKDKELLIEKTCDANAL